jgi:hypothetical protein
LEVFVAEPCHTMDSTPGRHLRARGLPGRFPARSTLSVSSRSSSSR